MSGPRAEFWKLRGLRGNKKNEKNARRTRDDLLQLTIQGKFPAYERVLLREGCFSSSHADYIMLNHVLTQLLVERVLIILNCLYLQPISNGPLSFWVLLMILPWRSWPERCLMNMRWQVGFFFLSLSPLILKFKIITFLLMSSLSPSLILLIYSY